MALHAEQVVRGLDALRTLVTHALIDPLSGGFGPGLTPALAGAATGSPDATARRFLGPMAEAVADDDARTSLGTDGSGYGDSDLAASSEDDAADRERLIGSILLAFDTRVIMDGPVIARAYGLAGLLSLGVGTFNCFMMLRFPIYQRFWSILMRPLFLLSCVFFLFDTIPEPYSNYLWYNPLVHLVGMMRHGFYPNYDAPYLSELYVAGFGLVALVLGLMLLRRDHKTALER